MYVVIINSSVNIPVGLIDKPAQLFEPSSDGSLVELSSETTAPELSKSGKLGWLLPATTKIS